MAKLTKSQIVKQLTALGIEFDPDAKLPDLLALLPADTDVSRETDDDADVSQESAATEATVHDPHGNPHRTYSKEVHGDNFRQLAEQFVSHPDRRGWTVK